MGQLMLVLGGARSGKSAYAQRLAQALGGEQVLFVATAEAGDEEMARRIARHQQARPAAWRTVEAPLAVAQTLHASHGTARVVLVDCLSLLVSNVLMPLGDPLDLEAAEGALRQEVDRLLNLAQTSPATWIVVSNEVGLGLVPETPLGRVYRDLLGQANQTFAACAQAVYLLVAGLPIEVKALSSQQQ